MITLLFSMAALVLGYIIYGKFVDKVFAPDPERLTPATLKADGIDYVPLPAWKAFMIQFLNIAGTGPIFGAILGAQFGPSCYLWIVLGCIFGGGVHDYFTGMLSMRHGGAGMPVLCGEYLGGKIKKLMLFFSLLLLLLVGVVFVYSPAVILGSLVADGSRKAVMTCVICVLLYYIIATLLPVDKLIGRIYPIFAIALLFMGFALFGHMLLNWPASAPELWDGLQNRAPQNGSIFPCMFVTIACGAISGFHATQSPLMARCLKNEKLGRPIFYGSMITEGIIALIWAAVSSYFFYGGGNAEMGAVGTTAAPAVVTVVSKSWLGTLGSILAILGVVAAPITSGDTALRSARLIIAETAHIEQKHIGKRLSVSLPIFVLTGVLLWFDIAMPNGFDIIWRYFGWANQSLAVFVLLTASAYLAKNKPGKYYLIALIPACFLTSVCITYICTAKIGFNMPDSTIPYIGAISFAVFTALYFLSIKNYRR
ncbi:MAG: carbon starvation protein A [Bacteroidales bacterium]|nr:carbon starvation protein A [Bacteroidales bacterium]